MKSGHGEDYVIGIEELGGQISAKVVEHTAVDCKIVKGFRQVHVMYPREQIDFMNFQILGTFVSFSFMTSETLLNVLAQGGSSCLPRVLGEIHRRCSS